MVKLTKQEIRERIRYAQLTIGTTRANFFASDVAERKIRYIVAIFIFGDGTASRTVEIERVKEDDTYEMIFDNIPVAPAAKVSLPNEHYNIEDVLIVLEGGTNLSAVANAGAPEATVIYWDDDV